MGIYEELKAEYLAGATPTGDYTANVQPPARSTAAPVTLDRALTLPAVLRSIQIIAGIGSGVAFDAWRGTTLVPESSFITQPDPWRPREAFIERLLVDLATEGNYFILKHRHMPHGPVVAVEALDPYCVRINWKRDRSGRKTAKIYEYTVDGGTTTYTAEQVEHARFLEIPGRDRGLGPIAWCRATLGGALDVRAYADNWFQDTDVPSGILTTDHQLGGDDAKRYKQAWTDTETRGPQIRVLGHGLTYEPITLNPADAQWLESQNASTLDIARMFGLPADYLLATMEKTSLTYTTLEMSDSRFVSTTLDPGYLRKIAASLSACLPRGQAVRFRTHEIARPDAKTQAEIDAIYIGQGVYDADHVRTRLSIAGPAPTPAPAQAPAPIAQEN